MNQTALLIAVVDDEVSVRRALQRLLRSAGHDVAPYESGQAFLDAVERNRCDCVVLDLHMPQVSGFQVQQRLAEADMRMPTVIITGFDTPESRERALRAGASAFLRKPVDGQALLDAIDEAVNAPT